MSVRASLGQACDLASQSTQAASYKDWWWKVALGKCYYRLGMFREAEKQFKSALKQQVSRRGTARRSGRRHLAGQREGVVGWVTLATCHGEGGPVSGVVVG